MFYIGRGSEKEIERENGKREVVQLLSNGKREIEEEKKRGRKINGTEREMERERESKRK
jgi:hypothetical protein